MVWIDTTNCKAITHCWTSSDAFRHSVDSTELRRKMNHVLAMLNDDEGLLVVGDMLIVRLRHVLRNTDFLIIVDKHLVCRI